MEVSVTRTFQYSATDASVFSFRSANAITASSPTSDVAFRFTSTSVPHSASDLTCASVTRNANSRFSVCRFSKRSAPGPEALARMTSIAAPASGWPRRSNTPRVPPDRNASHAACTCASSASGDRGAERPGADPSSSLGNPSPNATGRAMTQRAGTSRRSGLVSFRFVARNTKKKKFLMFRDDDKRASRRMATTLRLPVDANRSFFAFALSCFTALSTESSHLKPPSLALL